MDAYLGQFTSALRLQLEEIKDRFSVPDGTSDAVALRIARDTPEGLALFRKVHLLNPLREETCKLVFDPRLHALARLRFGDAPAFWNGMTHVAPAGPVPGEEVRVHADYASGGWTPDPWSDGLRFWCALEDIDLRSGPFFVYRGSHRSVTPKVMVDILKADPNLVDDLRRQLNSTTDGAWRVLHERLHAEMSNRMLLECTQQGLQQVVFTLRKGDVVAFNPGTTHGTATVFDDQLSRKCLIFDLISSKAKLYPARAFWSPLHDYHFRTPSFTQWLEARPRPLWIRPPPPSSR